MSNTKRTKYINLGDTEERLDNEPDIHQIVYDENEKKNKETELVSVSTNNYSNINQSNIPLTPDNDLNLTNTDEDNKNKKENDNTASENEHEKYLVEMTKPRIRKGNLIMCFFNSDYVPYICIGPDCK